MSGLTRTSAAISGCRSPSQTLEGAPHGEPHDDHRLAPGGQLDIGGVGGGRPVLPAGGHHVGDRRSRGPGNSGSSTVRPASARASASPRMDWGLPVNPCRTSAPRASPAAEYGSAPGRMGAVTLGHATGEPTIVPPIRAIRGADAGECPRGPIQSTTKEHLHAVPVLERRVVGRGPSDPRRVRGESDVVPPRGAHEPGRDRRALRRQGHRRPHGHLERRAGARRRPSRERRTSR